MYQYAKKLDHVQQSGIVWLIVGWSHCGPCKAKAWGPFSRDMTNLSFFCLQFVQGVKIFFDYGVVIFVSNILFGRVVLGPSVMFT